MTCQQQAILIFGKNSATHICSPAGPGLTVTYGTGTNELILLWIKYKTTSELQTSGKGVLATSFTCFEVWCARLQLTVTSLRRWPGPLSSCPWVVVHGADATALPGPNDARAMNEEDPLSCLSVLAQQRSSAAPIVETCTTRTPVCIGFGGVGMV